MAYYYPEMTAAMGNAGYRLDDDAVPGIQVEDPFGRELVGFVYLPESNDSLLTGPDHFSPQLRPDDSYGAKADPTPFEFNDYINETAYSSQATQIYDPVPNNPVDQPYIPAATAPSPHTPLHNFSDIRTPHTPHTPSDVAQSPFSNSFHSPEYLMANQSPLMEGSNVVAGDLSESFETIVADYIAFSPTHEMSLFAGTSLDNDLNEPSSSKQLRVNTDVERYNNSSGSSLHSGIENPHEVLLPAPDLPAPRRESRHTFSGPNESVNTFRAEFGPMYDIVRHSRAVSAPLSTPPTHVLDVEDDSSDEDFTSPPPSPPRRPPPRRNSKNTVGPIAKPVVTSTSMKKASTARRLHAGAYKCHICGDTFTTNFSRKRHINSHTKKESFACTIDGCTKVFRNASDRQRHGKRQHNL